MPKKIFYVVANGFFGGGERVFLQLAAKLDKNEFEPIFICGGSAPLLSALKTQGLRTISADFGRQFNPGIIFHLLKILRRESPDVIHAQGARVCFYLRIASFLAWRRASRPVIISTVAAPVEEYDVHQFRKIIYTFLDKLTEKIDDHFIAVTESIKNGILRVHKISPDKISVIHNGIELDHFSPEKTDSETFRKELNIDSSVKLIVSIGRLSNVKGFEYLIEAAKLIFKENPEANLKFAIAGEGELRQELETKIRESRLQGKVILLGHRTDTNMILAASDIFVLPSIREGFPMCLLEAMAMKKAIISSDFAGVNEILADYSDGLVIPAKNIPALKDAINKLLNNTALAAELSAGAHRKVSESFGINKTIALHIDAYNRCLFKKFTPIKKILIINVSGIGDFVESARAIQSIISKFPHSKIDLLVSSKVFDYAKDFPRVNKVFSFPVARAKGYPEFSFKIYFSLAGLLLKLRAAKYDLAANLFEITTVGGMLRMFLLFLVINPKKSAGRNTDGRGFFFSRQVAENSGEARNRVYYFDKISEVITGDKAIRDFKLFYSDADKDQVEKLLQNWGIGPADKLVLLNPGSDRPSRRWSSDNFALTADQLAREYSTKTIILGSKNEKDLSDSIAGKMHAPVFSSAGLISIGQLVCLISKARLLLTTDSAAMHMAGLLNVPLVALMGPGSPERNTPYGTNSKMAILHKEVGCNPCFYWDCPKQDFMKCMNIITPQEVLSEVEKFNTL
ncbi:MAG TPA: hypothetical protein DEE98_02675 [Elusimicrobia bacterium]|nr:MAG: hypothetical protein A2278_07505 [Elusimicrobia bacterium RIFOXYA12_FULL_49_49]OGS10330.1 MAG: hypothetical protein A2204_07375 [Elusimicrobia bacterium RIFOXYA1_FULL_47_7]OGS11109.1 MAG: hypothetical protein A2386_05795 [Elusimicrobia bacterium RIFOXYB1_FULL_48_9]OGS16088.1 MAG: hypothetical protein A2251_02760 [Elusimicrobia bacterium RIFOXYA2_FULL_47_53]OGS26714.1 MAG: hypothetical protein A2339_03810 [Elusimicrobia bacterium RIFOXYB12_FULL_50_12]OGS30160.1 MAG: hypothetical protein